jgi:glycosyltransferase involved in cell wall biosynthesis
VPSQTPPAKLRIAQVAPLWGAIPPKTYGGIELLVHLMVEELVHRGHEVTLFASGDSETSATLHPICEENVTEVMRRGESYEYDYYASAALTEVLRRQDSFDVIHCHLGASKIPFSAVARIPLVHTLHTAVTQDDAWVLQRYPEAILVGVSHTQLAPLPEEIRRRLQVSSNACDFDTYDLATAPGEYLVFLARMGEHKNPADAIKIAAAVGLPLVLAGRPQSSAEEAYFREQIEPHIDGRQVRYVGGVNHAQKRELFRNAAAFLFPTSWAEPCAVAPIEAMASGLPVIAYRNGSVPEVIDQGITGVYADTLEELISLVPQALALDRRAIREHARKRFSHQRMVDDYLQIYQNAVSASSRGET